MTPLESRIIMFEKHIYEECKPFKFLLIMLEVTNEKMRVQENIENGKKCKL